LDFSLLSLFFIRTGAISEKTAIKKKNSSNSSMTGIFCGPPGESITFIFILLSSKADDIPFFKRMPYVILQTSYLSFEEIGIPDGIE